ncbi:hypothetical protein QQG55_13050 [Brugia pahangi]
MCGHVNERRVNRFRLDLVGKEEDTYHSRPLILFGSSHLANLLGLSQPSIPLLNDLRSSDLFQICFLEGNTQMRERYKKVYMRERSRNKKDIKK